MKLLFLCTHNACRSIVAEAVTRSLANSDSGLEVISAGSEPAGSIHPKTLDELHKRNFDTTCLRSQSVEAHKHARPTIVITVCDRASDSCPLWLGDAPTVHWGLSDPTDPALSSAESEAAFADLFDVLKFRLRSVVTAHRLGVSKADIVDLMQVLGRANIGSI
ncbi:MAG: arsenate reductase ArsC [Pseudomonadaceae bacterium]|nr:arsenate reductase ArsC [Pseudomonadaceae bacterium]